MSVLDGRTPQCPIAPDDGSRFTIGSRATTNDPTPSTVPFSESATETAIRCHEQSGTEPAMSTFDHGEGQAGATWERLSSLARRARRGLLARLVPRAGPGMAVADAAWDTLVVLDSCRYDIFAAGNHLDGELSKRRSRGSTSSEFFRENFAGETYHDIVYVSANPWTADLPAGTFHDVIPVYDAWDEALQTVTPAVMNDAVRRAHDRYPNKRIVAHYMQPHYPFIGERGRELDHRGYAPDGDYTTMDSYSIWAQLQFGISTHSRAAVIEAYRENLRVVLTALESLLPEIDGKVVISADHGNMLGECLGPLPIPVYGHHDGLATPELIEVPWLERPWDRRRETVAEPPVERPASIDDETVDDRMRALGWYPA